eukprot:842952-Pyramimonas_sp.AAC.1
MRNADKKTPMPHFAASWFLRHERVFQSHCPPWLPGAGASEDDPETACFRLGFCVCSDDGKKVKKSHFRMLSFTKDACPRKDEKFCAL